MRDDRLFKVADIMKMFRLGSSEGQRHLLYRNEEKGRIPKSTRLTNGSLRVRAWHSNDLPAIGREMGFLNFPEGAEPRVVTFSIGKGGTAKSTLAFNLGRMWALNGVRVLFLGLDEQESLTSFTLPEPEIRDLKDIKNSQRLGLNEVLYGGASLEDCILKTDLPTLHILPETPTLTQLEDNLFNKKERRECVLGDFLREGSDLLHRYDIVILDTPPSLSMTVRNALYAADVVVSPISCEVGCFRAISVHTENIYRFQENAKVSWENWVMVATRLAKNKLSHQILRAYGAMHGDNLIPSTVRNTVRSDEATAMLLSVLEHAPRSPLADDMVGVAQDIWERIFGESSIRPVDELAAA